MYLSRVESWKSTTDQLRRIALRAFLASIAVNALLGIWALLTSDFGQTEGKVLATSLLLSAAMLSVLVNGAPMQRRALWPIPAIAAGAGVASILGFIVMLWAEVDHEVPLKAAFSGLVVAVAATLAGLLALLPLRSTYEVVRYLHYVLTTSSTGTIVWGIWMEVGSSWYGRLLGVQSVLVAALTLAIPVLWRFGGGDQSPPAPMAGPSRLMTAGDLASCEMVKIEPSASLRSAIAQFVDEGVSFVVVEDSRSVAGIVSEHDVLRAIHAGADLDETAVDETMSTGLVTVDDDAPVGQVARLLVDHHVRHLLVLGDHGGVLSVHDVLAVAMATPPARTSGDD